MSDRFFLNHRDPARRPRDRTPLARRLIQPSERTITSRQLRQDIVSLAGLIGRPVLNQAAMRWATSRTCWPRCTAGRPTRS